MIKNDFKVGDKVTFGCYGYFDIEDVYTIVEIKETEPFLGYYKYVLETDDKHRVEAYCDEIRKL